MASEHNQINDPDNRNAISYLMNADVSKVSDISRNGNKSFRDSSTSLSSSSLDLDPTENKRMSYLQQSCAADSNVTENSLANKIQVTYPGGGNNSIQKRKPDSAPVFTEATQSTFQTIRDPNTKTDVHVLPLSPANESASLPLKQETPGLLDNLSVSKYNRHNLSHDETTSADNSVQDSSIFNVDTKYCYRHNPRVECNKLADKVQLTEIQNKLNKLPVQNQEAITSIWSTFANSTFDQRTLILQGLISQCCFPQLSAISHNVSQLLKIDFLEMLPNELALKILCYLDCQSLCNAAQVSTKWKQLADDDRVWRYMCEQHIDRKCPQCGWGLPLMAVKKLQERSTLCRKRRFSNCESSDDFECTSQPHLPVSPTPNHQIKDIKANILRKKRPWKAVYSERFTVERNWRKGYYSLKKFVGHTDGVLCCQFNNDNLLMTGSYDKTIKIWNTDTGKLIRTLNGHTMGIKALVFDDQKLISGGLDSTIKVWNYRTGECISSYSGHREGVISVDFNDKLIVSGSADKTIKVWHVDTRTCYTLRGHEDWVTNVKIHPPSKCLFSASDDSTIRLWDLETNKCIKTYGGAENGGHTAQVQCVIPFTYTEELITDTSDQIGDGIEKRDGEDVVIGGTVGNANGAQDDYHDGDDDDDRSESESECDSNENLSPEEKEYRDFINRRKHLPSHLITASLDNTIKIWDLKTGKCVRTQFGHIEGVWSIAADTFRIVSGAHDKSIKVWDLQNGQCMHTFVNSSSVSCVGLGDSRIACGLENGEVKMYCFDCK